MRQLNSVGGHLTCIECGGLYPFQVNCWLSSLPWKRQTGHHLLHKGAGWENVQAYFDGASALAQADWVFERDWKLGSQTLQSNPWAWKMEGQ